MNIEQAKLEYEEAKAEWHRVCVIRDDAMRKMRDAKLLYLTLRGNVKRPRPRPRRDALARGDLMYQAIKPCKRCGVIGLRYTRGKVCVPCAKFRKRDYLAKKNLLNGKVPKIRAAKLEIKQSPPRDDHPLSQVWR